MIDSGERLALGHQFHVAPSRDQAICEAAPHYEENMKMFGELRLVRALTRRANRSHAKPGSDRHSAAADHRGRGEAGGFLADRPEDIIEARKALSRPRSLYCPTPLDVQLEDLDRFAKEVIPAFRDLRTAAAQ